MTLNAEYPLPTADTPVARTYWVRYPTLLAGAYPGHETRREHIHRLVKLYDAGIRTVISLQEENETNHAGELFADYDLDLRHIARINGDRIFRLRFPIADCGVFSVDQMKCILDAIDLSLAANRPVYVHCFGGMSRTAMAIGCWLRRHGLADRSNVLETLDHLRKADAVRGTWKVPESDEQTAFVLNWNEGVGGVSA